MKKFAALTLFIAALTICVHAQAVNEYGAVAITVQDTTRNISKGVQPCIKTDIPQADKKSVEEAWKKAIRKETKLKVTLSGSEYSIAGTQLKEVSVNPLNVYAVMNEYPQHIEMNVCFEQDSVFLSKENKESEYLAARMFVRNFALGQYRNAVTRQIKAEDEKLEDKEKEISKLTKGNDKLHKSINSTERKVEDQSRKIATSEQDQQRVRNQIRMQKDELAKFKNNGASEAVVKDAEKKVKTLEKELSGLEKQEDKMHKTVEKLEATIRGYHRTIDDNEMSTELQRKEVTRQKELINSLKKKLEGIK